MALLMMFHHPPPIPTLLLYRYSTPTWMGKKKGTILFDESEGHLYPHYSCSTVTAIHAIHAMTAAALTTTQDPFLATPLYSQS